MPEIKLNLRPNLLRLFRYLSAIILNYLNQFRKRSNIKTIFIKPAKGRQEIILETQQEFIPLAEYLKLKKTIYQGM
ncbi:hypothetical protein OTSSIDO_0430 [Orientia tsutsugamushi str. Sido]|nr:hypothetical protein OTSSIDO_0430 [Orientia tsutsugamushi str. Sido]